MGKCNPAYPIRATKAFSGMIRGNEKFIKIYTDLIIKSHMSRLIEMVKAAEVEYLWQ